MRLDPLIGFQLRSGSRFALLELAPVFGIVSGLLAGMGPGFVRSIASVLFPGSAPLVAAPVPGLSQVLIAFLFTSVALIARKRLMQGASGWMLHLPLSRLDLRRSLNLGIVASCSVPTLGLLVLWLVRPVAPQSVGTTALLLVVTILQLICVAASASMFVLPVRLPARWVALAAMVLATTNAVGLGVAALCVVVCDRWGGSLRPPRQGDIESRWQSRKSSWQPPEKWSVFALVTSFSVRSLPARAWFEMALALLPLGAAALFVANNELSTVHIRGAERLGVCLAITLALSSLVEALHKNRPPASFLRSLPWSSNNRTLFDAVLFGTLSLPIFFLCSFLYSMTAVIGMIVLVFLAVRCSGHISRPSKLGAGMDLLIEGSLVSALVALVPWSSVVLVLLLPVVFARAVERNRNIGVVGIPA